MKLLFVVIKANGRVVNIVFAGMGAAEIAFQIYFETKSALGVMAADNACFRVVSGNYASAGIHDAAAGAGGDGSGCAFALAAAYHFEFIIVEKFVFLHKFLHLYIR